MHDLCLLAYSLNENAASPVPVADPLSTINKLQIEVNETGVIFSMQAIFETVAQARG